MNPRVTIIRAGGSATVTMIVAAATIVNPWYVQPEPGGDAGGWLFNDTANSSHMMLTWD